MSKQKTVLFLTHSELGQASVILAVAHELAVRSVCDVHISSFSPLKPYVDELNTFASDGVIFHTIPGRSMKETLADEGIEFLPKHANGVRGAVQSYREGLPYVVAPWEPASYEPIYQHCLDIVQKLEPELVVLDPLFGPGADVCNVLGRRYLFLSPVAFKDHVVQEQPLMSIFWKYPVLSSGYPYPLPARLVLMNIYLIFKLVFHGFLSSRAQALSKWRNSIGVAGALTTMYSNFRHDVNYIVQAIPQSDFPLKIPSNVIGCGPIVPPFKTTDHDMETGAWLARRPTLLFNLGSHAKYTAAEARQVIEAFRIVLSSNADLQILWKCQLSGEGVEKLDIDETIPAALKDRIKVTSWLTPSPMAILAHDNTIAYAHHGGSNSFHEALITGVAQIVCPVWLDTYEFATRAEFLGIGVRGNRKAAPSLEGYELGTAICQALEGSKTGSIISRARELRDLVLAQEVAGEGEKSLDKFGVGRRKAAKQIISMIG